MKQITLSGVIGWDVTAQDLRDGLRSAGGDDVEIIISSPGGFVSTGLEMYNLIRNYPGQTTARLSGYAMSIASYIPLAANRIVAEDNAIYMIHNVRGGVWGDHNDILAYGATTKGMSGLIARAYAKRTGKSLDDVTAMMDRETYFFGRDMIDHAFVDEIIDTGSDTDIDTAKALAAMAYTECNSRMAADIKAVHQDLAACATILAKATAPHTSEKTKEKPMTKEQLRTEHPDLYQAILAEGVASVDQTAALAAARAEGAAAENARIKDVRAQAIPGHEALIDALALDGKSTGADAALAIVAAEKALRTAASAQLDSATATAAVTDSDGSAASTMKRAEFNKLSPADKAEARKTHKIVD